MGMRPQVGNGVLRQDSMKSWRQQSKLCACSILLARADW